MEQIPRTHEGTTFITPKTTFYNISIFVDIEAQIREIQSKKKEIPVETTTNEKGVGLGESGFYDSEIYDGGGGKGKYEGYVTSIAANDDADEEDEDVGYSQKRTGLGAPVALLNDVAQVNYFVIVFFSLLIELFRATRILTHLLIKGGLQLQTEKMSTVRRGVGW